jgi:HEAT repeat protein
LGPAAVEAVPALMELLKEDGFGFQAAQILDRVGVHGSPAGVTALTRMLQSPRLWLRFHAAHILRQAGAAGAGAALPVLAELAEERETRLQAAEELVQMGQDGRKAALPALQAELRDPRQPARRLQAIRLLQQLGADGEKTLLPALAEMLSSGDAGLREQALPILARMDPRGLSAAVPGLIDALTDYVYPRQREVRIRVQVAELLGRIGPAARAAVPAMTDILEETDDADKDAIAQALARIAPRTGSGRRPDNR